MTVISAIAETDLVGDSLFGWTLLVGVVCGAAGGLLAVQRDTPVSGADGV
jgi:hypothetical protein